METYCNKLDVSRVLNDKPIARPWAYDPQRALFGIVIVASNNVCTGIPAPEAGLKSNWYPFLYCNVLKSCSKPSHGRDAPAQPFSKPSGFNTDKLSNIKSSFTP